MTETAPERIWASPTRWAVGHGPETDWLRGDYRSKQTAGAQEFVRADLLDDAVKALTAALEWIDAVPRDTPLPAMPGFDRDEVDATVEKLRSKP